MPKKKSTIIAVAAGFIIVIIIIVFFLSNNNKLSAKNLNLLIITLDTVRADSLGAYGYELAQTKNLDYLARKGILFENCYAPVPLTLPSHCSIFTGKYPLTHGVRTNGNYFLQDTEITLAEKMKNNNYHTFAVIASFVLLSKFGLDQGFDVYDDTLNSHLKSGSGNWQIPAAEVFKRFSYWFDRNHNRKFFAWVHFFDPHEPYTPPAAYARKFEDTPRGKYDAEIAYTDEYVGKIIRKLKSKNLIERTLVVVVGDHGEGFGEHQEFGHGIFCYQESLKVPLIFYNPGLFHQNISVETGVNIADIMPTLLELFGLQKVSAIQGESFVHLLKGKKDSSMRPFYFESMYGKNELNWAPLLGILENQHKYISLPEPELYNLDKDPDERHNMLRQNVKLAKELDQKLKKWVASHARTIGDSKRTLSREDLESLQSLGYISPFSYKSRQGGNLDPKKGIILDNKLKAILKILTKGDLEGAEKKVNNLFKESAEVHSPVFYDILIRLHEEKNEPEKKLLAIKEAQTRYPELERFQISYVNMLMEMGNLEEAERVCQKLLNTNPHTSQAYLSLAQMSEIRNNIESALNFYKKALEKDPHNISLKIKYGDLLIKQKEYLKALSVYDELVEQAEILKHHRLLFKIAGLNFRYGPLDKAEALLRRAIHLNPKGEYFFYLALTLYKNKKINDAVKNMKIAVERYGGELGEEQRKIANEAIIQWERKIQRLDPM